MLMSHCAPGSQCPSSLDNQVAISSISFAARYGHPPIPDRPTLGRNIVCQGHVLRYRYCPCLLDFSRGQSTCRAQRRYCRGHQTYHVDEYFLPSFNRSFEWGPNIYDSFLVSPGRCGM
ncbi:hypothetical protein CY34DRAFT_709833 [Suillus luteus UH-Slu-Lm8-n1]|uniref:Uncharacterized protein n=1 Tax=Suillus luteus UH-Slu-Lm8-n1 TaxID=930992 RepID=A0A0D0A0P6_9AGAM|nr:hypothetical protein CY34DRAFT_709833 [Suillus luteus UH-Slu-Lm8-n1]